MKFVYWLITAAFLGGGAWANWYIFDATGRTIWSIDVLKNVFHNFVLVDPFYFPNFVCGMAAILPGPGAVLLVVGLVSMVSRRSAGDPQKTETGAAPRSDEKKAMASGGLFTPKLGAEEILSPPAEKKPSILLANLKQAAGDIKESFGINFDQWRRNRIRLKGEGSVEIIGKQERKGLKDIFAKKKPAPKKNLLSTINPEAPVHADGALDDIASQVVEWYGVWGKAEKTGRTETMEKLAFELKAKMTQQVQDIIIEKNGPAGLAAIDALLAATIFEKGIGGFVETAAEAVEQPAADDLVDHEIQAEDGGFSDIDEGAFRDSDSEDAGQRPEFRKPEIDRMALDEFKARFPAGASVTGFDRSGTSAGESGDGDAGLATGEDGVPDWGAFGESAKDGKIAGEGGASGIPADDINGLLVGPLAAGSQETGPGEDGAPDWSSAGGSGDDTGEVATGLSGLNLPWEDSGGAGTDDGHKDDGHIEDEEMPEGFPLKKFKPSPIQDEEDGFTPEGGDDALLDLAVSSSGQGGAYPDWEKELSGIGEDDKAEAAGEDDLEDALKNDLRDSDALPLDPSLSPFLVKSPSAGNDIIARTPEEVASEERAISALLRTVSPSGRAEAEAPVRIDGVVTVDEDLREIPGEDLQPISTVIPEDEVNRAIRKLDKGWLRFGLGMVDKGARTLERQFAEAGLADLKSRNMFIPALWAHLTKVVDYQTQAYAWEHFGDVPPANLATPRQRAEFLFDAVTAIVAMMKQVPAADLAELADLKAGMEQVKWIAAGRAERLMGELKRSGAVEPGRTPAGAGISGEAPGSNDIIQPVTQPVFPSSAPRVVSDEGDDSVPAPVRPSAEPSSPAASETEAVDEERARMAAAARTLFPKVTARPDAVEEGSGLTIADEDLKESGLAGREGEAADFVRLVAGKAEADGLATKSYMRFADRNPENPTPEDQRTIDLVIGAEMMNLGGGRTAPMGKKVVGIVVIDIPSRGGYWKVSAGERGRPQLKFGGDVIDLRTNAFYFLDVFAKRHKIETKKILVLRMDPLSGIEGEDGAVDAEAVANALDGEISVRLGGWEPDEWRREIMVPVLG